MITEPPPLISIIIPIYKVEPYLRRCLDSIVNQTYTNLEIILVDDGSPDGCPAICDEYATKDKRIIVIHKENGGLSDARNAGLDICKGKYISFVDSDDWVADCYIEILFDSIKKYNADISVCKFKKTAYSINLRTDKIESSFQVLSSLEAVKKLWTPDSPYFGTAWAKLYKKKLWNDIRFPIGQIHEDDYTLYKILFNAINTVFLETSLYFYFQRNDSIMARVNPNSICILKARWERFVFFKRCKQDELVKKCLETLCWDFLFAYSQAKLTNTIPSGFSNSDELLDKFRLTVKEYSKFFQKYTFRLTSLIIFSKMPSAYLLYRKISPLHIRKF